MLRCAGILVLFMISGTYCASLPSSQEDTGEYACINCTAVRLSYKQWNSTELTKLTEFTCTSSTQYCDTESGTCRRYAGNDTCAPLDSDFVCSNDGYFPHPTNCKKYYSCIKGSAYLHDCGADYYDVKSESCQADYTCFTLNCAGKTGTIVAHEVDPSFYGYCVNGTVVRVDKCPGQFKMDTESQKCLPVCDYVGLQGDPIDCTRYYKCSYESSTSSNIVLKHLECPDGEFYDALNSYCTPTKEGGNCQSGTTVNRHGGLYF